MYQINSLKGVLYIKRLFCFFAALMMFFAVGCQSIVINDKTDPVSLKESSNTIPEEKKLTKPLDIVRVVDGDTIVVNYNGKKENVRFIGVNLYEL